jgi:hypothetical protein
MTLDEAKALLATCKRDELRDHAFGDCEITWEQDGKDVAWGYFGIDAREVSMEDKTVFLGEEADALRSLGARGGVERNDSTGPVHYVEGQAMHGLTPAGVLEEITTPPWAKPKGPKLKHYARKAPPRPWTVQKQEHLDGPDFDILDANGLLITTIHSDDGGGLSAEQAEATAQLVVGAVAPFRNRAPKPATMTPCSTTSPAASSSAGATAAPRRSTSAR